MRGKYDLVRLEERISKLEFVGEVLVERNHFFVPSTGERTYFTWEKFKERDVTDLVDGYQKIQGGWYDNSRIFRYDSHYSETRKRIEEMAKKGKLRKGKKKKINSKTGQRHGRYKNS